MPFQNIVIIVFSIISGDWFQRCGAAMANALDAFIFKTAWNIYQSFVSGSRRPGGFFGQ